MADELWIDVLPSMAGFGAKLVKGANASAKEAGAKAGKGYSDAFEDGAGGASDAAVKELETAEKRAAGLVSKLAGDVSKARQTQQTATANLLTAEQRLADDIRPGRVSDDRWVELVSREDVGPAADERRDVPCQVGVCRPGALGLGQPVAVARYAAGRTRDDHVLYAWATAARTPARSSTSSRR